MLHMSGLPLILDSQLKERIIPTFEEAPGPRYQALIIVDNLQGHSVLRFNLVKVEIRELRPKVVAEGKGVLVHYHSEDL